MVTYNISINDELAEEVEKYMKRKKYANRSELFRDLIREKMVIQKMPNKTTLQSMQNIEQGKDLAFYDSPDDFFKEVEA